MTKLEAYSASLTDLGYEQIKLIKAQIMQKIKNFKPQEEQKMLNILAVPNTDKPIGKITINTEDYEKDKNKPIRVEYNSDDTHFTIANIYMKIKNLICRVEIVKSPIAYQTKVIDIDEQYMVAKGTDIATGKKNTPAKLSDIKLEISKRNELPHIECPKGMVNILKTYNIDPYYGRWDTEIKLNLFSKPIKTWGEWTVFELTIFTIEFDAYNQGAISMNYPR